jgi:hypothetical protein
VWPLERNAQGAKLENSALQEPRLRDAGLNADRHFKAGRQVAHRAASRHAAPPALSIWPESAQAIEHRLLFSNVREGAKPWSHFAWPAMEFESRRFRLRRQSG